jgi:hypothetical protein
VATPTVTLLVLQQRHVPGGPGEPDQPGGPDQPGEPDRPTDPAKPGTPDRVCTEFGGFAPSQSTTQARSGGLRITAIDPTHPFWLNDVVNASVTPEAPGSDGKVEVGFPPSGVQLDLPDPCVALELYFIKFTSATVEVVGFDAAGSVVATATVDGKQGVPLMTTLTGPRPIVRIQITEGGSESRLFRICCVGGRQSAPRRACEDFADFKPSQKPQSFLTTAQLEVRAVKPSAPMHLIDVIDQRGSEPKKGNDGSAEINFADSGIEIALKSGCSTLELWFYVPNDSQVTVVGSDKSGQTLVEAVVWKKTAVSSEGIHRVELTPANGQEIWQLLIEGGGGEAVLFKICCVKEGAAKPTRRPRAAKAARTAAGPTVQGIIADTPVDFWPGRLLATREVGEDVYHVVEFSPAPQAVGPWNGARIEAPTDVEVTLLSICGVDEVMVNAHADDSAARQDQLTYLNWLLLQGVEERREVLLEPGQEYEIEIAWSWEVWQSNSDGTNSPPVASTIEESAWKTGTPQVFAFGVASEPATAVATGDGLPAVATGDGLNEYVFDAHDTVRYLTTTEPADGRTVHFTDDPVWAHFDSGHVEHLLEAYDRELVLEVKRTDPPPQASPADLQKVLSPLDGVFTWHSGPTSLQPTGYQRLSAAIIDSPCLPESDLGATASVSGQFKLEPSAMYDFNVLAQRRDAGGSSGAAADRRVVNATRFTTSRYRNPEHLLAHLGFATADPWPFAPDDIIAVAGAEVPTAGLEISDAQVSSLLTQLGAETLPLPVNSPATYAVWQRVGEQWLVAGFLIDSLEPMLRTGTIITATGTSIVPRCEPTSLRVQGTQFDPVRAGVNWTRVFFAPPTPLSLNPGQVEVELEFATHTGLLTGRRIMSHRPGVVEREGL